MKYSSRKRKNLSKNKLSALPLDQIKKQPLVQDYIIFHLSLIQLVLLEVMEALITNIIKKEV